MTVEELTEAIKAKQAIAQSAYSAALLALGQAVYKSNRDQDLKCPWFAVERRAIAGAENEFNRLESARMVIKEFYKT